MRTTRSAKRGRSPSNRPERDTTRRGRGVATPVPATPALAADVYVVHAIPGVDLGLDPALAVDIEVDDAPLLSIAAVRSSIIDAAVRRAVGEPLRRGEWMERGEG